jgi:predicted dehydrogenase
MDPTSKLAVDGEQVGQLVSCLAALYDFVVVDTPPGVNELTAAALDADKHVYVAGLPAQQEGQVQQLLRSARRRGRCLVAADVHRFDPALRKLSELVRAGELGDVLYAESERRVDADDDLLWRVAPEEIALLLSVLGDEPIAVSAHGETYLDVAGPELLDIRLEFATGIVARLWLSALDARAGSRCTVVGARATAVVEPGASPCLAVHTKDADDAPALLCPRVAGDDPVRKSCEAFLAAVRAVEPAAPGRDVVEVVEVLEQVDRSLKRVPVAPDLHVVTQPA